MLRCALPDDSGRPAGIAARSPTPLGRPHAASAVGWRGRVGAAAVASGHRRPAGFRGCSWTRAKPRTLCLTFASISCLITAICMTRPRRISGGVADAGGGARIEAEAFCTQLQLQGCSAGGRRAGCVCGRMAMSDTEASETSTVQSPREATPEQVPTPCTSRASWSP